MARREFREPDWRKPSSPATRYSRRSPKKYPRAMKPVSRPAVDCVGVLWRNVQAEKSSGTWLPEAFRASRLVGTRIRPTCRLKGFAIRHSATASRISNPVARLLFPVVVDVLIPRLEFSVSAKKKTFLATCPPTRIRTRRMKRFCW